MEQKRVKMERLMEGFAWQHLFKGEIEQEIWKPSSSTIRKLRTKNPSIGFFYDAAWEAYIQEHAQKNEPEVSLAEEDLQERRELVQLQPMPKTTPESSETPSTTPSKESPTSSQSTLAESQSSGYSRHNEESYTPEKNNLERMPSSEDHRLPTPPVSQGPGNTKKIEKQRENNIQEVDQPLSRSRIAELNDMDIHMIQHLVLRVGERARNTELHYSQSNRELEESKRQASELQ